MSYGRRNRRHYLMHEFSIASQAVDKIMEAALAKGAKRIRGVEVLIGEFSLIGKEQFTFWMNEMLRSKGEIASSIKIDVKTQEAVIKCNQCGYEGNLKVEGDDHLNPAFYCPFCKQGNIQIKKGRECVLNRIQIEM